MAEIRAADVKALRERTGAGMMDCKAALVEAGGAIDKAVEVLRVRGQAQAAKRSGRSTGEGIVASYIHATGKVGAMVELQCETDFVARNDELREFARDIALHIAAASPTVVSAEQIDPATIEAERRIHRDKALEDGKPDAIVEKIVDGQIVKWQKDTVLLQQPHVNLAKHDGKTIDELRAAMSAKTGENLRIARFARFVVGEE